MAEGPGRVHIARAWLKDNDLQGDDSAVAAERVRSLGRLLYLLEQRALNRACAVVGGLATTDPSPEYQAGVNAAVASLEDLARGEREREPREETPPPVE